MNKLRKKRMLRTAAAAVIGAAAGTIITGSILTLFFAQYKLNEKEISDYFEAKDMIEEYYYKETDDSTFMSNALKGVVAGLGDPYASYMTPDEYKQARENMSGTLTGIGVTVTKNNDGKYEITAITPDSPASESDIRKGDIISRVQKVSTENMDFEQLVSLIKGNEGTTVNITLKRSDDEFSLDIERRKIDTVTAEYTKLDDSIGYIRISAFKEVTKGQFLNALKSAIEDGVSGIVIDLRNNGGGNLSACEACLDPLLPKGEIASAEFKDGHVETICESDADEIKMPLAILVNGNTASASELFSSALRDFNKAKLVGTKTFGKGIMQNTMALKNGGAIKLTVARYKTAKSPCFHEIGLEPDYEVELPEGTDITKPDADKDAQLKKAVEILK